MNLYYYLSCHLTGFIIYLKLNLLNISLGLTFGIMGYNIYNTFKRKRLKEILKNKMIEICPLCKTEIDPIVGKKENSYCYHHQCKYPNETKHGYKCMDIIHGLCSEGEDCLKKCAYSFKAEDVGISPEEHLNPTGSRLSPG